MTRFAPSRVRSLFAFGVVALLGLVVVAVPSDSTRWGEFAVAASLTLLVGALALVSDDRVPAFLHTVPALVYVLSVALLRDALGGFTAGVGILVLLPVIWTALHGTRAQLGVVIGAIAVAWIYPVVFIGGTRYPEQGLRSVLLLVVISAVLGDAVQRLVGRVRADAAERAVLIERLEELAGTDHLTGLPNRRTWTASLTDAMAAGQLGGEGVAVALIDLDRLKEVNDQDGHAAGDALLRGAAARWQAELGALDLLARLGGDEFGVVMPTRDLDGAIALIERLRDAVPGHETASA
ncbi:MAG TPA: GGDEF domain-containing protein, partial [Solirubrobacteraceae bacterium]